MIALVIASTSLRRLVRDRTAMFFAVLLPLVVILIVGTAARGYDTFRVGVVGSPSGPLAQQLVAAVEADPAITTASIDDLTAAGPALRRGEVVAVLVVPQAYDAELLAGQTVTVDVLANRAESQSTAALTAVAAVIADQGAVAQAAGFAAEQAGGTVEEAMPDAAALATSVSRTEVAGEVVDARTGYLPGGFSYSAPTMMVLFIFINALAGGAAMVQTRRLGIHSRALAAPVRPRDVVLGEALTYLGLALMQSVLIVGAGALVFGVDWGDPLGAAALVAVWALVGTGAGMLSGTVFRTPEQASSIGPAIGIALGMLGGTMWPLEIVGPTMRRIGHLSPHAWAVDGWVELLSRGGGLADIALQLAVLAVFAVALLGLATVRLRRRLTV